MIYWKLEYRKIDDLKKYFNNPRIMKKEANKQLKTSIAKFGLIDKPVINLNGTIIGGHQRIRALIQADHKEIECWIPNRLLDDKEVKELCIRLNKNQGTWDYDILADNFDEQELIEWGFSERELFELETDQELDSIEAKKDEMKKEIQSYGEVSVIIGPISNESELVKIVTLCENNEINYSLQHD